MPQSLTSVRGGITRPKASFQFKIRKWPYQILVVCHWQKPELDGRTESHQDSRKPSHGTSDSSTESRKKEIHQGYCYTSPGSSLMEKHYSNSSVFNMGKGHHLHLRYHPSLLHNLKWFNIKPLSAIHPIIQEVDELLAKSAIEWATAHAGFYSNVFVVPKSTGGYLSLLNLMQFNCYIHMHILRYLLSDKYGSLFSKVTMFSLLITRMLICIFVLLTSSSFLHFVGQD